MTLSKEKIEELLYLNNKYKTNPIVNDIYFDKYFNNKILDLFVYIERWDLKVGHIFFPLMLRKKVLDFLDNTASYNYEFYDGGINLFGAELCFSDLSEDTVLACMDDFYRSQFLSYYKSEEDPGYYISRMICVGNILSDEEYNIKTIVE